MNISKNIQYKLVHINIVNIGSYTLCGETYINYCLSTLNQSECVLSFGIQTGKE